MLRRSLWIPLAAVLLAVPAHANVPLPSVFAFSFPVWLGLTFFLFFLATMIGVETVVLVWRFHQPWRRALGLVALANFASTAAGVFLSAHPLECLVLPVFFLTLPFLLRKAFLWEYESAIAFTALAVFCTVLALIPAGDLSVMIVQIYGVLALAFGLTVLIEAFVYVAFAGPRAAWRWSLSANLASYAVLLAFLWTAGFNTGVIAYTGRPIHEATFLQNHAKVMERLSEVYESERSARGWRFRRPLAAEQRTPFRELSLVRQWAEEGGVRDAEELYKLVRRYREPQADMYDEWRDAREALASARDQAAAEVGGSTPEKPLR